VLLSLLLLLLLLYIIAEQGALLQGNGYGEACCVLHVG
jgi:hypothetical protein